MYNTLRTKQVLPGNNSLSVGLKQSRFLRQPITRRGLVGEYLLDGNAEAVVGPNGTATNMTWGTDGVIGYQKGYGIFNGSTSYVGLGTTSSIFDINASHTICFWMKTNTKTNHNIFYSSNAVDFRNEAINIRTTTTLNYIRYNGTDIIASTTITNGTDLFITAIYNASENKQYLYVNGVLKSSIASTTISTTNGQTTEIGRGFLGSGANDFSGNLQILRIPNVALTQSEINNLYYEGLKLLH